jgi:TolB protein
MLILALLGGCVLACVGLRMLNVPRRESIFTARPASNVIAFETDRGEGPQIYVMYPDGTQQTRLTYNVRLSTDWWWPFPVVGGDRIPYMLLPSPEQDGSVMFRTTFEGDYYAYSIYIDGSQQVRIPSPRAGDPTALWSPARSELAFTTAESQLFVVSRDGTTQRCLTCASSLNVANFAWSPEGQQIVFSGFMAEAGNIYRINRDGTGLIKLTNISEGFNDEPAWSLDGQRIAFRSNRDGPTQIYVMNADGSGEQRLTTSRGNDLYPAWSPDGQHITFTSYSDNPQGDIYIIKPDGSGRQRLTMGQGSHQRSVWIHVPASYCKTHVCEGVP